ncbi:DinB family protein [Streptomyces botrytidirepellens]|uniref:DinB family protein n=1 Tax=Streptomyces botrytidirepellens TaxID=2486417 RepID=A0A3M8WYB3_9ACTN|nr:DinB family protein [Streptomyces botrytidirepellens]RNG34946.1 DinB family protein [Streptomyces botrytidirepellens]
MQDQNEYLYFLRRAFDGMLDVLEELGDDLANTRPPLPGANSVYAIAYHCAAVADYWTGHVIAGREIDRDRASEFTATGHGKDLHRQVDELFEQLKADLAQVTPSSSPRNTPPADFEGPDRPLSVQGVQLHVLEELAQHYGQIQITRDLLKQGASS